MTQQHVGSQTLSRVNLDQSHGESDLVSTLGAYAMKRFASGDQFAELGTRDVEIVPHWYMYPPKGYYKDRCDYDRLSDELACLSGPVNLYIHIPFCAMKCSFCTLFASVGTNRSSISQYIDALLEEITLLSSQMNARSVLVRNLYVGGGTPSILSERDLRRLFEQLRKRFNLIDCDTVSVEFSPDTVDRTSAALWKSLGVTRASLGVQSFSDHLLKSMRRKHTANDARSAVELLLAVGFTDLNIDLIYGHSSQDINQWCDDLGVGLKCGATSITIHPLAIRESTGYTVQLYRPEVPRPTPPFPALYEAALGSFTENGWSSTSAVSFSNRDFGNPLEEAEANGIPTLGLGAGARTYLSRLHTSSVSYGGADPFGKSLERYYHSIGRGLLPTLSSVELSAEEETRRIFVLSIVGRGIDLKRLSQPGEVIPLLRATLDALKDNDLICIDGERLRLTPLGLIHAASVGLRLASPAVQRLVSPSIAERQSAG